jgi:hypothetical protein
VKGFFGLISRIISSYPGLRRGSLFLIALVFLVPNARAQLTHADSLLAKAIDPLVKTLAPNDGCIVVISDTALAPLTAAISRMRKRCQLTFFIEKLSTHIQFHRTNGIDSGTIAIQVHGVLLDTRGGSSGKTMSASSSIDILLTPEDVIAIRSGRDRYIGTGSHEQAEGGPSFWSSVVEPALVILGAAAIVALFFLLRS